MLKDYAPQVAAYGKTTPCKLGHPITSLCCLILGSISFMLLFFFGGPYFTFGIFGGVICVFFLLIKPTAVSAIILTLVVLAGGLDVPRLGGMSITNIALAVAISRLMVANSNAIRNKVRIKFPLLTFLFVGVLFVSSTNSIGFSLLVTPLLAALLSLLLLRLDPKNILLVFGVVGLVHSSIGLIESLSHSSVLYTSWKDESAADIFGIRRAASTVGDPNYLAATLICTLPGIVYLAQRQALLLRILIPTVYTAALMLTFSRGGIFACLAIIITYTIINRDKFAKISLFVAILTIFASLIVFLAFTDSGQQFLDRLIVSDASIRSRSVLQRASFGLFLENWVTGLGIGELPEYLEPTARSLVPINAAGNAAFLAQTDPLNSYLLIGAEGGVLALFIASLIIIRALKRSVLTRPSVTLTVFGVSVAAATLDLLQSPVVWCFFVFALYSPLLSETILNQAQKTSCSKLRV